MSDCIDTVEAVRRLASDIADHEVSPDNEPAPKPFGDDISTSVLVYRKRELAIELLYDALCNCELTAWVRSATGGLVQLLGIEWRGAMFWRDTIVGGVVHASACELWEGYDGEVLLEAAAFQAWREARKRPAKPPVDRTRKGTRHSKQKDDAIREALRRINKEEVAAGKEVPNYDRAFKMIKPIVKNDHGFEITRADARFIAGEEEFAAMRRRPGRPRK